MHARYLFKMGGIAGGKSNLLQMLSVASSFLMLGTHSSSSCAHTDVYFCKGLKVSKLPQLKALLDYVSKQKKKCARTTRNLMEDIKMWVGQFPQLKQYASKFEGTTAERMLQLKDNDLVNEFCIGSEVDRLYLLMQLARVREHERVQEHARDQAGVLLEEQEEELENTESKRLTTIEMATIHASAASGVR